MEVESLRYDGTETVSRFKWTLRLTLMFLLEDHVKAQKDAWEKAMLGQRPSHKARSPKALPATLRSW